MHTEQHEYTPKFLKSKLSQKKNLKHVPPQINNKHTSVTHRNFSSPNISANMSIKNGPPHLRICEYVCSMWSCVCIYILCAFVFLCMTF